MIRRGNNVWDVAIYVFFVLFSLIVLYPFWDMLILSFSDPDTASLLGVHLYNEKWSLSAYRYIIADGRIYTAYVNTIVRAVITTAFSLVTTMLAAYPLSKRDLPHRNAFTLLFLFTMYFSGGLVPTYMLIRDIGLINTRWALIVPGMFSVYNMIIMRNYLMSLDPALEEAAFIEGAGYITVLVKIVVPLSKPVLATIALWVAVANWNAWFDAMIYVRDKRLIILQTLLREVTSELVGERDAIANFNLSNEQKITTPTVRAATIMLTIGPIVLVYPFVQKYFVKGIMIGSLKG